MTRKPTTDEQARTVDTAITLDAPVDVVWRAITDAEELTRWFPLDARVTPGVGGTIWMSWHGAYEGDACILAWEPERHLKVQFPADGPEALVTDYFLEAKSGGTVLRVVTSGFGAGADWDQYYEGVRHGWDFELRGLRHYLERHRGTPRLPVWVRTKYTGGMADAWGRATGPGGWFGAAGMGAVSENAPYRVATATGDALSGTVLLYRPPRMLVATVAELNDALLRLEFEGGAAGEAWILLSTYGVPEAQVRTLEQRWGDELARALGDGRAG